MVSVWSKPIIRGNVMTQTPHTSALQVSSCSECLSLLEGGRDITSSRCEQGNDLLSLVAQLKEVVERPRSIREHRRGSPIVCPGKEPPETGCQAAEINQKTERDRGG